MSSTKRGWRGHNWGVCLKCGKNHGEHPKGMLGKHRSKAALIKFSKKMNGHFSTMKGKTFEEMYGINRAKEMKEKLKIDMSKWHNEIGRSKETCKKISDVKKSKHFHFSEDTKNVMSTKANIRWMNPSERDNVRQQRMKQTFPLKHTSIELKMANELSDRGYAFYMNHTVGNRCQPDIAFPELKVCVECDGDYWHNLAINKERDARNNQIMKQNGWLVLRYWEHEINANVDGCVDEIEDMLMSRVFKYGN